MIQKNVPRATALNLGKGINIVKKMPGTNTIKEYFMPFAKHPEYSSAFIFNNNFKYRIWIIVDKLMENKVESAAPINPKYFVAGYNKTRKTIVLTRDACLNLSGLPVAKTTFIISIDKIYRKTDTEKILQGIATVLYSGAYIVASSGPENAIRNVKKGIPKIAVSSDIFSSAVFILFLSS